jgi:hypothetical protein
MGGRHSQKGRQNLAITLSQAPYFENAPIIGLYPPHTLHKSILSPMPGFRASMKILQSYREQAGMINLKRYPMAATGWNISKLNTRPRLDCCTLLLHFCVYVLFVYQKKGHPPNTLRVWIILKGFYSIEQFWEYKEGAILKFCYNM